MIRLRFACAVAVMALAPLTACGAADGQGGDERPFATYDRGTPPDAAGEMHASALDGTLVLRDGCLYLQASQRWLPVFPHDIDWDGRAQTLQVPPWEASVRVGEQVVLAGGEVPYQPEIHTVPDSCDLPSDDSGQAVKVWLVGMVAPPTTNPDRAPG